LEADSPVDAKFEELTWSAHPARERIREAVFAVVVILTVSTVMYLSFQSIWWGLLAVLVLIVSLNRFFFPSRFKIDPRGITAHYPLRTQFYGWKDVRRFRHDRNGGYLSTRYVDSRFDAYRGMHLLFGNQKEAVVRQIRMYLEERSCQ
jgi:hypothetical protein